MNKESSCFLLCSFCTENSTNCWCFLKHTAVVVPHTMNYTLNITAFSKQGLAFLTCCNKKVNVKNLRLSVSYGHPPEDSFSGNGSFCAKRKAETRNGLFFPLCVSHFSSEVSCLADQKHPLCFYSLSTNNSLLTNASFSANGHRTILLHMFSRMNTVRPQVCFWNIIIS